MSKEERRIHKERRERQKRRCKDRQKEKAKQEKIADHCRRVQNRADGLLEERIKSGELTRNTRTVDNVETRTVDNVGATKENRGQKKQKEKNDEMAGPPGVAVSNVTGRKRTQTTQRGHVPEKKAKTVAPFEISPLNVTISTNLLGSGSYGCCYLASYRGMEVVSKNFVVRASRGETHGQAEDRVLQELVYEAHIIRKLGGHPGVPLLLGICSKRAPFRIIMQFHGDRENYKSVTIHRALSSGTILGRATWLNIIRKFASALLHMHDVGFLHDEIKANNILLDIVDGAFNPVIIDFGKSLPMGSAKGPKIMSQEKQKKYTEDFPHIAPEIITGKTGQSRKSDIYSFGKVVKSIFRKANLCPVPQVFTQTLEVDPMLRPNLQEVLKATF